MPKTMLVYVAPLLILLLAHPALAGVMLSLSSPNDLSNLNVGESVQFDVTLSGLGTGEALELLSADIIWSSSLLGPPSVTAGAIIPDPLGFTFSASGPGRASVFYDGLSTALPLTNNGIFFSFSVSALSAGSGNVGFDSISPPIALLTSGDVPDVSVSSDLPVTVHGTQAVPEPSMFCQITLMVLSGIWCIRRKASVDVSNRTYA